MIYGWVFPDKGSQNLTARYALRVYIHRLTPQQKEEITHRLDGGEVGKHIARSMGIPTRWVYDLTFQRRRSRQLDMPQSRPDDKFLLMAEMWAEGKTYSEIAAAYGYTQKRVEGVIQHYRKMFGWFPMRRPRKR